MTGILYTKSFVNETLDTKALSITRAVVSKRLTEVSRTGDKDHKAPWSAGRKESTRIIELGRKWDARSRVPTSPPANLHNFCALYLLYQHGTNADWSVVLNKTSIPPA